MATPSPAENPPRPPAAPSPPQRDQREDFIPPSLLSGQDETRSLSSLVDRPADAQGSIRLESTGSVPASIRSQAVPGSGTGDLIILLGLILAVLGFLVWRSLRSTVRENFAGQDHNKD